MDAMRFNVDWSLAKHYATTFTVSIVAVLLNTNLNFPYIELYFSLFNIELPMSKSATILFSKVYIYTVWSWFFPILRF